jgi:hypothetical protein
VGGVGARDERRLERATGQGQEELLYGRRRNERGRPNDAAVDTASKPSISRTTNLNPFFRSVFENILQGL